MRLRFWVQLPHREIEPEGFVEIGCNCHKECLTGICKYSDYLIQAILAHEFLMWIGRCCLFSILLFGVAVVGWELSPFPSTYVSHNQRPLRERLCFLGLSLQCLVGVFVSLFPGGSHNRPPLFAPSFTRCIWCIRRDSIPPFTGDARLPENTQPPSLPCSKRFLGSKVSRLLSSTMALPLVSFSVVPGPWTPSRMVMLLRHYYDHLGRQEGHCKVL